MNNFNFASAQRIFGISILSFLLLGMWSCKDSGKKKYPSVEEMNQGELALQCDESLRSIMLQQSEVFVLNFPEAKVNYDFQPEQMIVENLMNGSVRTAVISRELTKAEMKKLEELHQVKPRQAVAAKNAIALISAKNSGVTKIAFDDLKAAFQSSEKTFVVEGKYSFMMKSIVEALELTDPKAKLYALNTTDSVVAYIKANPSAIGFISYPAISDEYDERVKSLLNEIQVVGIEVEKDGNKFVTSANQSDIFLSDYPLITPINYVVTDFNDKLSIGYMNFLFRTKAGRVFVHAGLVPSVMPEREVIIDTSAVPNAK